MILSVLVLLVLLRIGDSSTGTLPLSGLSTAVSGSFSFRSRVEVGVSWVGGSTVGAGVSSARVALMRSRKLPLVWTFPSVKPRVYGEVVFRLTEAGEADGNLNTGGFP